MKSESTERIEVASAVPSASQRQLWLDVSRPIQTKPPRVTGTIAEKKKRDLSYLDAAQIEMRMEARRVIQPVVLPPAIVTEAVTETETEIVPAPQSFASWLLDQAKRPGTLGELAKAARLDRSFPKTGSADAVRARFNAVGADGDAFEALDDAEREYDRSNA